MNEVLTIEEIRARFDGEWVLIAEPQENENRELVGGKVVAHSKDRDEVYRRVGDLPVPRRFAIRCFVPEPEGMEFLV